MFQKTNRILPILMLAAVFAGILIPAHMAAAQTTPPVTPGGGPGGAVFGNSIVSAICNVFLSIRGIIFIVVLSLMVLGGVMYAVGPMMPNQLKGQFQGYGMGIIVGSAIGLIIVLAAPYIISLIIQASGAIGSAYGQSGTATSLINAC